MKSEKVVIIDPIGIHARPASLISGEASKYQSKVEFRLESKVANAKSIINLMALGVKKGNEVSIEVDGPDQDLVLEAILKLMKEQKLI